MMTDGIDLPAAIHDDNVGLYKAIQCFGADRNTWWHRIWTIQETILPPTLVIRWGPLTMAWETLENALDVWTQLTLDGIVSGRLRWQLRVILTHCAWLYNARIGQNHLYDLIQTWAFRQATNPRDKVYGMLGLCEAGRMPVTVLCDYNVPPAQVFATVTRELIVDMEGLRPLVPSWPRPDESTTTTPDTPSWAMELACTKQHHAPAHRFQVHFYELYRADEALGSINLEKIRSQSRQAVLSLEGFRIDEIVHIEKGYRTTDAGGETDDFSKTEAFLRQWYEVAMRVDTDSSSRAQTGDTTSLAMYPGAQYTREEAFLRLVMGGVVWNNHQMPEKDITEEVLEAVKKVLNQVEHEHVEPDIRYTMHGLMLNSKMFVTRSGLIGIGQLGVKVGDEVWIFKGGRVPFTIRPRRVDGDGGYSSHCHCYVQGIMMGEVGEGRISGLDLVDRTVDLW